MKTNFLKTLVIATGMLAICFGTLTAVYGQSDYEDIASAPLEGGG